MKKARIYKLFTLLLSGAFLLFCLPFSMLFSSAQSVEDAQDFSVQLSRFSTWFSQNDGGRCRNIALAAQWIDGVTVQPYGEFSFNKRVGKRTKTAGFQEAKIILQGEFVKGVGGGVCQVSTTLYNAALLAGLTIEEFHAHSLPVSYVPPSRDAMVSSASDLVFTNPYPFPVRIRATTQQEEVTVSVYGKKKGGDYKISSIVTGEIPPPKPIEKEASEGVAERDGKKGLTSEAYLERYEKGVLVSRKKLRTDAYAPQRGVVVKKNGDTTKKMP